MVKFFKVYSFWRFKVTAKSYNISCYTDCEGFYMGIVKFVPREGIKPIFAVKLSPSLSKIIQDMDYEQGKKLLKTVLNVKEKRVVNLKQVEDGQGNFGHIFILYDYIYNKIEPKVAIPQTEEGYFDFKIYQLDFNRAINLENIIEDQKMFFGR